MVIGAESCEWRRVTWLAARVESMFAKSAVDPDKINPYLFLAGRHDLAHDIGDFFDAAHNVIHGRARMIHERRPGLNLFN